ncbi:hypothetical protein D1007_61805 [Hordeum vulgare]|nr:hypothetical protein D1007_61805 [Hordeum vulgare]
MWIATNDVNMSDFGSLGKEGKREEQNQSFNGEDKSYSRDKEFCSLGRGPYEFLFRQEDPEKKQPHRAKVYLATHRTPRKAKDKNKLVVDLENIITEHPELAQSKHGRVAWKGDALHKVLGNEKRGQVHGMGLLPVPNQVYGRKSRYLKNINVTTIDGSSHDGEAYAMEEIAKLKQLIEQQDKIIDALRNNDGFRGANEITMENSQTVRNGESHPEVLHNNKRKIRKSKENMIENLTRLSKQSTQDKSPVHVSCKQKRGPSMKVGTQVILKSSTYPNKRHVAHATILGCKSKQLVGGVELGRQFIEVQVDQPIDECELLIERFSG